MTEAFAPHSQSRLAQGFLALIGTSQLILGTLTLFAPISFSLWMGLSAPPKDGAYLLAMQGARFLGLGVILFARRKTPSRGFLQLMALIQILDLAAGAVLLAQGTLSLASAAFPMTNATLFALGLLWLARR